jgi:DNA-binding winged helix-turn-helix (wHTH) protein
LGSDAPDTLPLLATPRAARLLGHRADLDLVVHREWGDVIARGCVVVIATVADDLDGSPRDAVHLGVFAEPPPPSEVERFADYVFTTATRSEITFRARRALERRLPVGLRLHADSLEVGGRRVPLSAVEQRLIERLLEGRGASVARSELEHVIAHADTGARVRGRALDAHIYRLRRKLRDVADIRIETVRQRGFALASETPAVTSIVRSNGDS